MHVFEHPSQSKPGKYRKAYPGNCQGPWIDGLGEMVRTNRFAAFQDSLKRLHPDLFLAFDRVGGWWTVMHSGKSEGRHFPSLLLPIREHFSVSDKKGWVDHYAFRNPDDVILRSIAAMPVEQLRWDNDDYLNQILTPNAELRWRLQREQRHKQIEDIVKDAAPFLPKHGGTEKVRVAVGAGS